jgi:cell filamentation protein
LLTGTLSDLQAIHRHLFQDVFAWAGQIRTIDIAKPDDEPFLSVKFIQTAGGYCAEQLQADRLLTGLPRDRFIERLSYHYDAFNFIHPFREGNGRTQRVFWSQVAEHAGWRLDWTKATGHTNDRASKAAHNGDCGPLISMFDAITQAVPGASGRGPATGQQVKGLARQTLHGDLGPRKARGKRPGQPGPDLSR